jgi:hypothetical protein
LLSQKEKCATQSPGKLKPIKLAESVSQQFGTCPYIPKVFTRGIKFVRALQDLLN